MIKLLLVLLFSLFLSGDGYAYDEHFRSKELYVIAVGKGMPLSRNDAKGEFQEKWYNEQIDQGINYCTYQDKMFFKFNQDFKKGFYRKFF